MRAAAALACLVLGVTGCALTPDERIARVMLGMSPRQVESYVGPATGVIFLFDCRGHQCDASASYFFTNNGEPALPIAIAIGPPSNAWSAGYRRYRADWLSQFGQPAMTCTEHDIDYGKRLYCFAENKLVDTFDRPAIRYH